LLLTLSIKTDPLACGTAVTDDTNNKTMKTAQMEIAFFPKLKYFILCIIFSPPNK
jgi:hypothetical protein